MGGWAGCILTVAHTDPCLLRCILTPHPFPPPPPTTTTTVRCRLPPAEATNFPLGRESFWNYPAGLAADEFSMGNVIAGGRALGGGRGAGGWGRGAGG